MGPDTAKNKDLTPFALQPLFTGFLGKCARIIYRDDAHVLIALLDLQGFAFGGIHVADARDFVKGMGDIHQILVNGGQWGLRPGDAQLLVSLGASDGRRAPDGQEDNFPSMDWSGRGSRGK